jgi:predicted nicotinamide N-methyase
VLATYVARWVEVRNRRVLEIGCGLGLPGITAAVLGGQVVLVDSEQAALDFASASAAANRVRCSVWRGDFTTLDPERRFDLILAAEVAYDPARFGALAAVFERHLAPDGLGLLADGHRTDTRGLYRELGRSTLTRQAIDVRIVEEEQRVAVRLTAMRKRQVRSGDSRRPPA